MWNQSFPQTFLIRETFDLREQMLLESTESASSLRFLVHRGKDSLFNALAGCTVIVRLDLLAGLGLWLSLLP